MGTKDSKAKEYLSDNTRFSEICNYVLFDGEKVIKPEDLKECDTTEVLSVFGIDKKQIVKQKWRDLLKGVSVKYTESVYIVLMGIEAQTDVHYSMPVKTMIYDAMNYGEQVNEAKKCHRKNRDYRSSDEFLSGFTLDDKLTPVITITLYLGTTQWDGPRSLAEMMPQMDERILPFINDYNKFLTVFFPEPRKRIRYCIYLFRQSIRITLPQFDKHAVRNKVYDLINAVHCCQKPLDIQMNHIIPVKMFQKIRTFTNV